MEKDGVARGLILSPGRNVPSPVDRTLMEFVDLYLVPRHGSWSFLGRFRTRVGGLLPFGVGQPYTSVGHGPRASKNDNPHSAPSTGRPDRDREPGKRRTRVSGELSKWRTRQGLPGPSRVCPNHNQTREGPRRGPAEPPGYQCPRRREDQRSRSERTVRSDPARSPSTLHDRGGWRRGEGGTYLRPRPTP